MNKIIKQTASCLVGVFLLYGGNAYAAPDCPNPEAYPFNDCSLPGIRPGSFPYFHTDTQFKYKPKTGKKAGDFNLKAKYDKKGTVAVSQLFGPGKDDVFDIGKTKYNLKVKVKDGVASGKVKIKGNLLGTDINGTLMTAKLQGDWAIGNDGFLLGVNTEDIECHEGFASIGISCTEEESVYLVLNSALGDSKIKFKEGRATAVTTVPIPAAAWLFGSGLLCLAGIARKRRHTI